MGFNDCYNFNPCQPQPVFVDNRRSTVRIKNKIVVRSGGCGNGLRLAGGILGGVGNFLSGINCFRRPVYGGSYGSGFCGNNFAPQCQSYCSPYQSQMYGNQFSGNGYAAGFQQGLQQGLAMASQFGNQFGNQCGQFFGQGFNNCGNFMNQCGNNFASCGFPGANFAGNICSGLGSMFNGIGSACNNFCQPQCQQPPVINQNVYINNNNTNVNNNCYPTTNVCNTVPQPLVFQPRLLPTSCVPPHFNPCR